MQSSDGWEPIKPANAKKHVKQVSAVRVYHSVYGTPGHKIFYVSISIQRSAITNGMDLRGEAKVSVVRGRGENAGHLRIIPGTDFNILGGKKHREFAWLLLPGLPGVDKQQSMCEFMCGPGYIDITLPPWAVADAPALAPKPIAAAPASIAAPIAAPKPTIAVAPTPPAPAVQRQPEPARIAAAPIEADFATIRQWAAPRGITYDGSDLDKVNKKRVALGLAEFVQIEHRGMRARA